MSAKIILASQSEFRKRALDILGLKYECIPPKIDEKSIRNSDPLKMARMISEAKALEIGNRHQGIIIAGDAFIVLGDKVLEKPATIEEAHHMLRSLSGNKYLFVTALAVYDTQTEKMRSSVATCNVYLREISEIEIQDYCSRYPVLKFAGAHETDGVTRFAEKIEGSCTLQTAISLKDLTQFLQEIAHSKNS